MLTTPRHDAAVENNNNNGNGHEGEYAGVVRRRQQKDRKGATKAVKSNPGVRNGGGIGSKTWRARSEALQILHLLSSSLRSSLLLDHEGRSC